MYLASHAGFSVPNSSDLMKLAKRPSFYFCPNSGPGAHVPSLPFSSLFPN